jgi:hypothetical protein
LPCHAAVPDRPRDPRQGSLYPHLLTLELLKQVPKTIQDQILDGTLSLTEVQEQYQHVIEDSIPKSLGHMTLYENEKSLYFCVTPNTVVFEDLSVLLGGYYVHNGNEIIFSHFDEVLTDGSNLTITFNSIDNRPYLFEIEKG